MIRMMCALLVLIAALTVIPAAPAAHADPAGPIGLPAAAGDCHGPGRATAPGGDGDSEPCPFGLTTCLVWTLLQRSDAVPAARPAPVLHFGAASAWTSRSLTPDPSPPRYRLV